MTNWLWTDDAIAFGTEDGEALVIEVAETTVSLTADQTRALLAELGKLAGSPQIGGVSIDGVSIDGVSIDGVSFLVYYRHELLDDDGNPVEVPELGEAQNKDEYLWDGLDLDGARARVKEIGATIHAAAPDDDSEMARAWVSLYRMPEDVRVWKGYWDELDETDDETLLLD